MHLLPHANNLSTNVVFISTLPAGSVAQAVTPADYESCAGQD
ncbi:MAG TPA: hypothetical protein VMN60_14270 [Longimicrobiales bacterium]|nr:hypothetical protein [Longimicrobiales bacterium]